MGVTSVRIQDDLKKPLEDLSTKLSRSRNWLINEALKEYISRQKLDSQKWRDTLEAIDSVKNGEVIDGDKVHSWLKSWGTENEKKPPKL